jgi:hypothetical protein
VHKLRKNKRRVPAVRKGEHRLMPRFREERIKPSLKTYDEGIQRTTRRGRLIAETLLQSI